MDPDEFKIKKCFCNGSPTCPECNDLGGINLHDDYKRAWGFQQKEVSIKKKILSEIEFNALFQKMYSEDCSLLNFLDLPEYKKSENYKRRKLRIDLLNKLTKRISDWQNLHKVDDDEDRNVMVVVLIDNISRLIEKLKRSI